MMLYGPLAVWILISFFGPYDMTQGVYSKLLYIHVPTVWVAYFGYTFTFIYSVLYFVTTKQKYDSLAVANAKSGIIFTVVTLLAGSFWGKQTWGTWWVWGDVRLNLTAILLLVYLGYIASRQFNRDLGKTAKNSSFIGIFGVIQIPILHFSVIWWRSVHQQASILSQETFASGDAPMSIDILVTLLISVLLATLVHIYLTKRLRISNDILWEDYLNPKSRAKI